MLAWGQAQGQPYLGLRENAVLVMDVTAPGDGRKIATGKLALLAAHVSSIRVGVSMCFRRGFLYEVSLGSIIE